MSTLGLEGGWKQGKNAVVKLKMFLVVKAIMMNWDITENTKCKAYLLYPIILVKNNQKKIKKQRAFCKSYQDWKREQTWSKSSYVLWTSLWNLMFVCKWNQVASISSCLLWSPSAINLKTKNNVKARGGISWKLSAMTELCVTSSPDTVQREKRGIPSCSSASRLPTDFPFILFTTFPLLDWN